MRRKRAIILFACQSFAWFTSKDEVTNRLSASADYDVTIIENFVPPKQWVPGETVEKDEAVVNTGSIDAFVRQMITSVLTVTVEVPTATAPTSAAHENYLELTQKEVGALESGSYLAWKPATDLTNKIGNQVVYGITNSNETVADDVTDFTPAATGLYVFRRSIDLNNKNTLPNKDIQYEYVGYYVVKGEDGAEDTYYKLYSLALNADADALEGEDQYVKAGGELRVEPTVTYSKEQTNKYKNAPMTYEAKAGNGDGDTAENHPDRLKIVYNASDNAAASNMSTLSRAVYEKYRDYLDQYSGKSTWKATAAPPTEKPDGMSEEDYSALVNAYNALGADKSTDTSNKTGLTNGEADVNSTAVNANYSNWSQKRLEDRATETETARAAADKDWNTLYETAKDSRDKKDAADAASTSLESTLATAKSFVGMAVTDTNYGLTDTNTDGDNRFGLTTSPKFDPHNETAASRNIVYKDTDGHEMTVENLDDAEYAWDGTYAKAASNFTNNVLPAYNSGDVASNSAYKTAYDTYVEKAMKAALIQRKIDLCNDAITNHSANTVGRDNVEPQTYITNLQHQLEDLDLEGAWNDYQAQVTVAQGYVDTLNGYSATVSQSPEMADPQDGVYNGMTAAEKTLYDYLNAYYGTVTKTTVGTGADAHTYIDPVATKKTVDDGISHPPTPDGTTTYTNTNMTEDQRNAVTAAPYFKDVAADYALEYRTAEAVKAYNAYLKALDAYGIGEEQLNDYSDIILYINLANIGNGSAPAQWQYIAGATEIASAPDDANNYNFYYTSVLGAGETSSKLIDSVTFDKSVTQDAFRKLDFDINVDLQSAQVVYEGNAMKSTAAKDTILGAQPTEDAYNALTDAVKWEKRNGGVTPTDDDPNPKAEWPTPEVNP